MSEHMRVNGGMKDKSSRLSESAWELILQEWAIPENIRTIPWTAFRNSEGKGGS